MFGNSNQKPVLITGAHRSGSTWLADMLALAANTRVIQEPFNISPGFYALDGLAEYWFTYAPALPQREALEAFEKIIKRKTGKVFPRRQVQYWIPFLRRGRLIIKDPMACLSSEWLAENFELEVIVLVRHPAAFAASLKRVGWRFPFEHFLEQDLLMREHLESYRDEIEDKPMEIIRQAALLWKCLYGTLFSYLERNPSWIVRTHERLSREPIAALKGLYAVLGLGWTDAVERQVKEYTREENPIGVPAGVVHQTKRNSAASTTLWKKVLTEKEIAYIYDSTYTIAHRYYPDSEW